MAKIDPLERKLQYSPAPMLLTAGGALLVLVSLFMPEISTTLYAQVSNNCVVQNDPEIFVAALLGAGCSYRYWQAGTRRTSTVAIFGGAACLFWVIFCAHLLTVSGVSVGYLTGLPYDTTNAAQAGAGLWTAGLGCLTISLGGALMRSPFLGGGRQRGFG